MSWRRGTTDLSSMNFEVFCGSVDANPALWNAPLVKTCTYIEKGKRVAPHRCLIIDVCLGASGHMCLRLDRRPSSAMALASRGGITRSNDEVTIARTISELKLEKYQLENVQIFPESAPTLRNLARVLRVFENNVKTYNLLSRNCWFLCSVIEELLPGDGRGLYAAGEHQNLQLALSTRRRVYSALVSDEATLPSPVAASATTTRPSIYPFQGCDIPVPSLFQYSPALPCTHQSPLEMCATYIALYLRNSVRLSATDWRSLSRMLNQECLIMLRQVHSESEKDYANHLVALHLHEYADSLYDSKAYLKAAEVETQSVEMTRALHRHHPDLYEVDLSDRLHLLGESHGNGRAYRPALIPLVEAIKIYRRMSKRDSLRYTSRLAASLCNYGNLLPRLGSRKLYHQNSNTHAADLAMRLGSYGVSLQKHGSYQEACDAKAESVMIIRKLYLHDPDAHTSELAMRLDSYGISLYSLGSYRRACNAHAESVNLTRKLYLQSPNAHTSDLAMRLNSHGVSLQKRGSYHEACDVKAESVALTRKLNKLNPIVHTSDLAGRLREYGISLHARGSYQEACDAHAEAVALTRKLYLENPKAHAFKLARHLVEYGISLRECGFSQAACDVHAESVALTRKLHLHDPNLHTSDLALRFHEYGISLYACRSYQAACDAFAESVSLTRRLHQQNARLYNPMLSFRLEWYAGSLFATGSFQEAFNIGDESVKMIRSLCLQDPIKYSDLLEGGLNHQRCYQKKLGEGKKQYTRGRSRGRPGPL